MTSDPQKTHQQFVSFGDQYSNTSDQRSYMDTNKGHIIILSRHSGSITFNLKILHTQGIIPQDVKQPKLLTGLIND